MRRLLAAVGAGVAGVASLALLGEMGWRLPRHRRTQPRMARRLGLYLAGGLAASAGYALLARPAPPPPTTQTLPFARAFL